MRLNDTPNAIGCIWISWYDRKLSGLAVSFAQRYRSFEWRGLPFTPVKSCLKSWRFPWKLVWMYGDSCKNLFEILAVAFFPIFPDLLCPWCLCLCLCLRVSDFVSVSGSVLVSVCGCACVCLCVCVCVCRRMCLCVSMCACTCSCVRMVACGCVCLCVSVCICVCLFAFVWVHRSGVTYKQVTQRPKNKFCTTTTIFIVVSGRFL